jgi:CheY-like chemotaxis protein
MLSLRRSTRRNVSSPSTVVCVDDNEFVLEVLDWYLESQGYKVVQCSNASQAVEIVEEVCPVAVTLDFEMPVLQSSRRCRISLSSCFPAAPRYHSKHLT